MSTKISVTTQGTVLKQPVETSFTYQSDNNFTGYSGEVVVEKGLDIKALFQYLTGDGEAGKITNGNRTVLKISGWKEKTTQQQLSIIEGIISDISLRIINFEEHKVGTDENKSTIFSIVLPKISIDSIPGLPIGGFKPLELSFEIIRSSKQAKIILPNNEKLNVTKGFSFVLKVTIPGVFSYTLSYPPEIIPTKSSTQNNSTTQKNSNVKQKDENKSGQEVGEQAKDKNKPELQPKTKVKWFDLNKKWGPVNLKRLGLKFENRLDKTNNKNRKFITLFFDTDFNFSKLQVVVRGLKLGLEATWPLKKPEFGLSGLGVLLDTKAITLGGLFVKVEDTDVLKDNYLGSILIRFSKLNIFAVGAYANYKGKTSVFVYGYLGIPVEGGGPFTLLGIAFGFGYNRDVVLPKIDDVASFPLVAQAMGNVSPTDNGEGFLSRMITDLTAAFPPKENNIFIAIGIKFNSYKVIEGFVLLFIVFGEKFKIQIIGLGTLSLFKGMNEPIIFIELALRVIFVPEDGIFALDGVLTSRSYILSKNAKLTGGFAMYFWFGDSEYADDFVITFGGYHKKFNVPSHYPRPPRMQLKWVVNKYLTIKAEAYFALTPIAIMAGGAMSVVFDSSSLYVSFKFYADFLMQWKPVFYDVHVGVDIHIKITVEVDLEVSSVTKTVSLDLQVELHIWGPEFSGKGRISFEVLGVEFSMGISFGANSSSPPPLSWDEFKQSFLPPQLSDKLSLTVSRGLLEMEKETNIYVIDSRKLELRFESGIPVTELNITEKTEKSTNAIGIFPTNHRDVTSKLSIKIGDIKNESIDYQVIKKSFPKGIWGNDNTLDVSSGETLIKDMISGVKITIKPKKVDTQNLGINGFDDKNLKPNQPNLKFDYEGVLAAYDDVLSDNNNHIDIYNHEFLRAKPALFL